MFVKHSKDVDLKVANTDGAKGAGLRWMLGPDDGMEKFFLRLVEVEPRGQSMHHKHNYEHEVFVLEGQGELVGENTSAPLMPGDAAYVSPNEIHQFRNTGTGVFKFICCIPKF